MTTITDKILDLIKDNVKDLDTVSNNNVDLRVIDDAITNLIYSVVEYQKAFWERTL